MSTAIAFVSNGWLCLDLFQRNGKALAGASGLRFTTLRASRNWGKSLTVIGIGSPHHDHNDPVGPRAFITSCVQVRCWRILTSVSVHKPEKGQVEFMHKY